MAQPPFEADAAGEPHIEVVVCYATATTEYLQAVQVVSGASIEQAVRASDLLQTFPDVDLANSPVGIFGKKKTLDTVLREHDRIEIYRPLLADPKETRRKRAHQRRAVE
jgi:putative ubiquitin-RnfH superfamily antitoxin RatB of RatAB toxin-antitoxin module